MTTNPLRNIRRTAVLLALGTGLAGAAAAPAMANSLSIGDDAALRYGKIDFDLHNEGADATVRIKLTGHGHVLAKGETSVENGQTTWNGVKATKAGRSLGRPVKARLDGVVFWHGSAPKAFSGSVRVYPGSKRWDGTYRATNGLVFKVQNGFGTYLGYHTLAYCTRSHTNQNAFFDLPYDKLPVIVKPDGTFKTEGHVGTGQIVKLNGRITRSHKLTGYTSWTWINIFYGSTPGDYDYCATGGKFHGRRVSLRGR